MRAYLLFLAIFFCEIAYANDQNNFYESRYNFLKNYIEQLKTLQEKDKNYKGSVVETISGSFFISFGRDSQNKIDLETLNKCNLKEGVDCKVRFQSLKKNKDYNRLAKFDKKNDLLFSLENKIDSKIVDEYKEIVFLKNIKTFNQKNFECKKNVTPFKQLIYLIKKEIDVYPIEFINNSGLKFVMICETLILNESQVVGVAPGHYDQSPGVFYISANQLKDVKNNPKVQSMLKHVFHHEFYHIIDSQLTNVIIDNQWEKINKIEYSSVDISGDLNLDNSINGFVTQYARNNQNEDKAELFAMLMTKNSDVKQLLNKDEVLFNKAKLLISRLKSISPSINKNFWNKLN
jgi:succinate dehydrogenase flavin-adding protein (antitoxin of CptAB toxin-antitoxin module)